MTSLDDTNPDAGDLAGRPLWTEGVCGDGAAILRDGVMVPIEEVVRALNRGEMVRQSNETARAALQQCAAPFVIKPAESEKIDWEGLAREFYRRMTVAGEALKMATNPPDAAPDPTTPDRQGDRE